MGDPNIPIWIVSFRYSIFSCIYRFLAERTQNSIAASMGSVEPRSFLYKTRRRIGARCAPVSGLGRKSSFLSCTHRRAVAFGISRSLSSTP